MDDVVIASTAAGAAAASAVEQHHAQLEGSLALRVEGLVAAAARHNDSAALHAKQDLVEWCERELVSHALAEEKAMYPAAHAMSDARLLIDGMLAEHAVITGLVDEIADATDLVRAAAAARALEVLFNSHLAKENELVLPLLTAAPDVSVAELLGGMHELLGGGAHHDHEHGATESAAEQGCGGHSCSCGEVDGPGYPELDARAVPHAIRHATIFGALDAVQPGGGLVLVAPHDPLPLLDQARARYGDTVSIDYVQRGPEAWKLQFVKVS